MRRLHRLTLAVACFAASSMAFASEPTQDDALIAKGKYLAIAADCGACHTAPEHGKPMAGGYAINSPLGDIIASNITPSKTAGIGNYSEEDFARSVRQGINKEGTHLYPAMPYTSYAKISDEDIHALYAYFMHGVEPVDEPVAETQLPFPFNLRFAMAGWNLFFADNQTFTPSTEASAEINRGDYLVNALAHCDTCHTPRNALMGQNNDHALSGGSLGSWYAPNITPDQESGIGSWSEQQLAQYLKTGHVAGKAQAAGPMAEAVEHSLQYLSDDDIAAMVAYLRQVPAVNTGKGPSRDSLGQPSTDEMTQRGLGKEADAGWQVFSSTCANCHQADGRGTDQYPSLFHNTTTGADRADNLIATIVFGVHRTVNGEAIAMPSFGPDADWTERLTDQQIADVANYVFKTFGNSELSVTPEQVKVVREGGEKPLIAQLAQPLPMTIIVIVLLAIVITVIRGLSRGKKNATAK